MNRYELLKSLIEESVKYIEDGSIPEAEYYAYQFKSNGIIPDMHVGCNKNGEMEQDTEESKILRMEWYAGALVKIAEAKGWYAVGSWLRMSDKILN